MKFKVVSDSFVNVLRGLGGGKDATVQRRYTIDRLKSFQYAELTALYATNWLASKVVDIPVNDALRSGRIIQGDNATEILAVYDDLKIDKKISDALKWARAYGGSILVIVSNDNDLSKPISIGKGDLKNIAAFDISDVHSNTLIRDPLDRNYLSQEFYQIRGTSQKIHNSRVIKLDGLFVSNYLKEMAQGFGLSIFEKLYSVIGDAQESNDLITNLIYQSNIDVYKMNGLNEAISADMEQAAVDRITVAQSMKSILNAIILDKDDDYSSVAKNFSGLQEIDMAKLSKVAGASDIPLTRLLGKSADGMNATGDGDLKNYYDMVSSFQSETIYDIYRKIDKCVCAHLGIPETTFEFNSLFQMSDLEKADIELKNAQTDTMHINNGVITETDVLQRLAEGGMYTSITMERVEDIKNIEMELSNVNPD